MTEAVPPVLPDITTTELFREAAAAARIESRRYWAQPGQKSYPVPEWREAPETGVSLLKSKAYASFEPVLMGQP